MPPLTPPGEPPRVANWGILAHVDAGKTSLTEQLLYVGGAIAKVGSVDSGTSQTDSMDIERRRGITVRTNVASFLTAIAGDGSDVQINLVDTPGHADFVAEVERSLSILDGAILVISAVEGVQPQTVVLWRALHRLGVPVLVFINKIDRAGADPERVVRQFERRLAGPAGVRIVALTDVVAPGNPAARADERAWTDSTVMESVADADLAVLEALVEGAQVSDAALQRALLAAWQDCLLVPMLAGSAITGAGVAQLINVMARLSTPDHPAPPELSAQVFKIDNDADGRLVWARIFTGGLASRDRVSIGDRVAERISALQVVTPPGVADRPAGPGDIVQLRGPLRCRIGDWLGVAGHRAAAAGSFAAPTLEAVVEPELGTDRGRMFAALVTLTEQDPLINLRIDEERDKVTVSLFGEVQKEVISSLLAEQFDVRVRFQPTTIRHIERINRPAEAIADMAAGDTAYLATLGVRIEPVPPGRGLTIELAVELGSMPAAFFTAASDGIASGLAQGRFGWPIPDARVTITRTGYSARQSHAHQKFNKAMSSVGADFRSLAPMLVHRALAQAGTTVCEPVDRFTLDTSLDTLDTITALLSRNQGIVKTLTPEPDRVLLTGTLPVRLARDVAAELPDQSRGDAVWTVEHSHYQPVAGPPPRRARIGADPLDSDLWQRTHPR